MKKYKAIAIPVSFADDKPRFLTVRDYRFKDWIFVTGGCRRREIINPLRCALRELEEETRGVVSLKNGEYTEFKFTRRSRRRASRS
jgi:8-oxo-dGTP pyrophosphatase MutT (NUDIX family)